MKPAERKVHRIGFLRGAACFSLCLFMAAGCIREEGLENCPTGIEASFTAFSPCGDALTLPESSDLHLFFFEDDRLVDIQTIEGAAIGEADFRERMEITPGTYTVIAWAGLETGPYDRQTPEQGVTAEEDLLFRVRRTQTGLGEEVAASADGSRVWTGRTDGVVIPEGVVGSYFAETTINLVEVTNRVTVQVSGVEDIDRLEAILESNNGSINYDNTLAPDRQLRHDGVRTFDREILSYHFTTLDLAEGLTGTLTIEENDGGEIIWQGDLLAALIERNPGIDLSCETDFNLLFNVSGGQDTYMITEIWVNEWLVYSYDAEL